MEKTLKVDVVNAEESLFSGNAEFVALPGIEGELGILPGHTPLITLIRPGQQPDKYRELQYHETTQLWRPSGRML